MCVDDSTLTSQLRKVRYDMKEMSKYTLSLSSCYIKVFASARRIEPVETVANECVGI